MFSPQRGYTKTDQIVLIVTQGDGEVGLGLERLRVRATSLPDADQGTDQGRHGRDASADPRS